jgi:AbrB family looped-hinge helix DNA binding protein
MSDLQSNRPSRKVREAAVEYIAGRRDEPAVSTISSKNQITLPAQLLRELGLGAGDRLAVSREGNRLILRARPKDWVAYYGGSMRGVYGNTREEIDEYIRELRQEDPERDKAIEEAWAGRKPPAQE